MVEEDRAVAGLVTPSDVRRITPERWNTLFLRDVMRPLSAVRTIQPDAPVTQALEALADGDFHQLPVVTNGTVLGTISRTDVLRLLRTRNDIFSAVEPREIGGTGAAHDRAGRNRIQRDVPAGARPNR
jgi:CBS-domain-containing membrane protein